ncbi:MAG TPA: FAD-dependent oxidoreductase [Candidatus Polarisedimenticolia bacterium]|nr:FAD-dependent oxidoreductase [Candidatus Polarisedimenticolia bacterium]
MSSPAVVIIGAGVMGASLAWHLGARGHRDVLLLDREAGPARGSTGAATGGFRAQFETPINIRLSLLSRAKLRAFRDEVGADCGYQPSGYLWLAGSAEALHALAGARRLQHAEGLTEAVEVGLDDIARLNPEVRRDRIVGGAFCPTDGFIRPRAILEGYLDAALQGGAQVAWGESVVGFETGPGGRITAVRTARRTIPADVVVDAAGAWAGEVARLAGFDLPVTPLRRQVAITEPCDLLPASMPMTIFLDDGFHLRVREGRVLLLWPTPGIPGQPWGIDVDPDWIDAVVAKAHARVPALDHAVVDRAASWAGLYEMSPDRHAILGAAPGVENLFLINGSSGHGVMHAPALGALLAEIILDGRATTIDVAPLRPSRFAEGAPNPVSELL